MIVANPTLMNDTFARVFNSRDIDELSSLYEAGAILVVENSGTQIHGLDGIRQALERLLAVPGSMTSRNNFCVVLGDTALLRADWRMLGEDGTIVMEGSSAEVLRRQPDGSWKMIIDHAIGSSLPRVDLSP